MSGPLSKGARPSQLPSVWCWERSAPSRPGEESLLSPSQLRKVLSRKLWRRTKGVSGGMLALPPWKSLEAKQITGEGWNQFA